MADRHAAVGSTPQANRPPRSTAAGATTNTQNGQSPLLRKLYEHAPNSTQLIGLLTLILSGGILLVLAGITITTVVLGLIFFGPILIISSPIWVPIGAVLFFMVAGFLSMCGFGITALAAASWLYRYFRGLHPPGSDRFDYARSRIVDTASHVKDYAREYGGYLHSKVKDAAPGA